MAMNGCGPTRGCITVQVGRRKRVPTGVQMVTDSYVGNGAAFQDIVGLPFQPKHVVVLIFDIVNGTVDGSHHANDSLGQSIGQFGADLGPASMVRAAVALSPTVPVVNGFRAFLLGGASGVNQAQRTYHYTAWG